MKENEKVQENNINIQKKNEQNLEEKLQYLSEEISKMQVSFSNLLAQDKKTKKQIENIVNQKNDLLDNEIWITNRIEEAKQETESLISEKIKKLNYEKTIRSLNENLEKLNKNIEQLDYNKSRALESLEEDLSLKIEDSKVIEENILEAKITDIAEENIKDLKKEILSLEKKINKQLSNLSKEQTNQETNTAVESLIKKIEATSKATEEKQKTLQKNFDEKIKELNIDKIKSNITKIEDLTSNKIDELSVLLEEKIQTSEIKNEQLILDEISKLELNKFKNEFKDFENLTSKNAEEIKNNINKLEETNIEKIKELEETMNTKIEDINHFDMIRNLENSLLELKEKVLNAEYINKEINKKVEELDSINQNKLDKVRKEQEKFIIKKISELDGTEEISKIKSNLEDINDKIQNIELSAQKTQEKMYAEMKDYVEKRILRLKFATTIHSITEELNKLNSRVEFLENSQNDEAESREHIEDIIKEKLQEQENEFIKNIEVIIEKKLNEQEHKLKKRIKLEIQQNHQEYNTDYVESIVEEKVKETIKEMVKKQKAKKASNNSAIKRQENIKYSEISKRKDIVKNTSSATLKQTRSKIADPIYNTQKIKPKTAPTSLEDMVATLSNLPNAKSKKATQKTISALSNAVKKSQILNYDN